MSDTWSLFPPFGDPWPSFLFPSQYVICYFFPAAFNIFFFFFNFNLINMCFGIFFLVFFFFLIMYHLSRVFLVAHWWRICLQCRRPQFNFLVGKIPWRKDRLPPPVFWGFPGGSDGKESACNVGDLGSVPGLGRSPGGGQGNPLQYSCLENPHGQRSLAGYSPWGLKESDTTQQLNTAHTIYLST